MTDQLITGQGTVSGRKDALVNDMLVTAGDANDLIRKKLDAAGSSLGEASAVLAEKVRCAAAGGNNYVKGHPWQVLGLAAAVGVIVGILSYRR